MAQPSQRATLDRGPGTNDRHPVAERLHLGEDVARQQHRPPLGIQPAGAVRFSYGVAAGNPSAANVTPTEPSGGAALLTFRPLEPWFVGVALANRDGDTRFARVVIYSFSNEVGITDDTE